MMLPVTAYAAKIAASTTIGAVTAVMSVFAQTDPLVTIGGATLGIGTFTAGVYKLLADHTAQEALRDTLEKQAQVERERADAALAQLAEERALRVDWHQKAVAAEAQLKLLQAQQAEGGTS